jgi:hypothetical protein
MCAWQIINHTKILYCSVALVTFSLLTGAALQHATAEFVPEWIKNTQNGMVKEKSQKQSL